MPCSPLRNRKNDETSEEESNLSCSASPSSYDESFECCEDIFKEEDGNPTFYSSEEFFGLDEEQRDDCRHLGKIFPLIGRLEHVSLKDDFQIILSSHPEVVSSFLNSVGDELVQMISKNGRSDGAEIIDAFIFVKNNLDSIHRGFFMDPVIAWPMEVIFGVSNYLTKVECVKGKLSVARNGTMQSVERNYATIRELASSAAILTFGKSVLAAFAVSMAETKEELPRTTAEMYLVAYDVGFVHRMVSRRHFPGFQKESFNLFVVGLPLHVLRIFLTELNKGFCCEKLSLPFSGLEPTIIFGCRSAVVSGHPIDISRLKVILRAFSDIKGVRVSCSDIMLSCPQNHHELNERVYRELIAKWIHEGVRLNLSRLKCTVLSPVTGKPWRAKDSTHHHDSFQQEVALALTRCSHVLPNSLEQMSKCDRLSCIGGGKLGVDQLLSWEKGIPALPELRNFFFCLKRQTTEIGVRQTLRKMAVINEAWNNAFPKRKRILSTVSSLLDNLHPSNVNFYCNGGNDGKSLFLYPFDERSITERPSDELVAVRSCYRNEARKVKVISLNMKNFFDQLSIHIKVDPREFLGVPNVATILEMWDAEEFLKGKRGEKFTVLR